MDRTDINSKVIDSLKDPISNIYLAAAHLSELKNVDFSNKKTDELTDEDLIIIATRYNWGSTISLENLKKDLSYGKSIYNLNIDQINQALKE